MVKHPAFDLSQVPTPCYVCDLSLLRRNLEILEQVQKRTGCRILMALKGFAMHATFPLIRRYLQGTSASSPHEARLGAEEFGGELHVYEPAYRDDEFAEITSLADYVIFNSFRQWRHFRTRYTELGRRIRCGLRINPEYSEVKTALYNPCAPGSRLGITVEQFKGQDLTGISGLHFHALCEQNADALEHTLAVVEEKFGSYLKQMEWINFGGGHHLTRADYDIERLCRLIQDFVFRHNLVVYMEPGEAIALNTGFLVTTVLDIVQNDLDIAILDTSASAHMPDVLEMPYRPNIVGAGEPGKYPHTYRLGGTSCLAGDVIGDYSFPAPLTIGQKLVFEDMAHYTMVKNTTFNGIKLPAIATYEPEGNTFSIVRQFGYQDYKSRLS